jgi:hypothetical protein
MLNDAFSAHDLLCRSCMTWKLVENTFKEQEISCAEQNSAPVAS